jgi:predicted lipoprotein with Yx(FWY)xxD motif
MKKTTLFVIIAACLCGASLAGGAALPTIKTADVASLGTVVVSSNGRTLYHYTDESKGRIDCKGACAKAWPPLLVRAGAKPVAGAGIAAAKLGVVKRPEGTMQVTYGGLPLYRFAGDVKAGEAKGQALENEWYAVSPAAKIVKTSAAASSSSSSSPGYSSGSSSSSSSSSSDSTTTTMGGSGYGY